MASWKHRQPEPFLTDKPGAKDQIQFLLDRKVRVCTKCAHVYHVGNHGVLCTKCGGIGWRKFNYMTIIAGRRWGKSRLGSMAGYDEACIPNTLGWAVAANFPRIARFVIPAFQKIIQPEMVDLWDKELGDLYLKNGSLIHFQSLDDPEDGRGQGLDWLWMDEACELTENHWNIIAPSLAGDTVAMLTTTPKSFDWVYERFYQPADEGEAGFWALKARSVDSPNPRLHKPGFLERERKLHGNDWYRQEYEADFVNFEGAIYNGGQVSAQILRTEGELQEFLPEWEDRSGRLHQWRPVHVGIDTGADHPFGAVKVVASERGLIVIGEYLERRRSFMEHAMDLKILAGANPTTWCINKNEAQPMIELLEHGIECVPAENEQLRGTERVKSWIYSRKLWFYEPRCPKTVKQMLALKHAERRRDDQDRKKLVVYKKNDELPDGLRYLLMVYPELPDDPIEAKSRNTSQFSEKVQHDIKKAMQWAERKKRMEELRNRTEHGLGDDFYA